MTTAPKNTFEMSLIAETHWDREWYATFQEFRFRLIKMTDKLLEILDTTPYANFFFDGQTSPLEDYLEIRPENKPKVLNYLKSGRISIGPSYILPDMFLVSGEAHIRNLLLGHKMAHEWGVMAHKVGYEPDAFGHIAQMPQIMAGFGINNYIFHRGIGNEAEKLGAEFWWKSPDGSKVLGQYMTNNYCNLANLLHEEPLDKIYSDAKERVLKMRDTLAARTRTQRLLLMNGCDHLEPERDMPKFIERFNKEGQGTIIHRSMEEHCTLQYNDLDKLGDKVPVWEGELHHGKEHPILTDTNSSRMYLKQMNHHIETLLETWADPLNGLATLVGGRDENPGYLWHAWKSLLQNHPHDSICGCSTDEVHEEMLFRFAKAEEIANIQITRALKDLARHISFYPKEMPLSVNNLVENVPIIVFNPLPYPVTKVADVYLDFRETDIDQDTEKPMPPEVFALKNAEGFAIPYSIQEVGLNSSRKMRYQGRTFSLEFIARVPAMGYAVYHLSPSEEEDWPEFPLSKELVTTDLSIENRFYKILFSNNGSFTVFEKKTKKTFPNCHIFIDEADLGDEYDFVPLKNDHFLSSFYAEATLLPGKQTPYSTTFEIEFTMYLPERLAENRSKRSSEENDVFVHSEITLFAEDPVIHIQTQIENACEDHRLRVVFPTGLNGAKCVVKEAFHVQDRSLISPKTDGWNFPPTGSDHTGGFTTLVGMGCQFSVFNKGLPNYEVISNPIPEIQIENSISQTLFRAVGWLGHPPVSMADGKRKYGAGPTMRTIDSQMLGEFGFEYGLYISEGSVEEARVPTVYQNWVVPAGAIIPYDIEDPYNLIPFPRKLSFYFDMNTPKSLPTNHALPSELSFFEVVGKNIEFSTLKTAEKGDGIVLRLWNSARTSNEAIIKCFKSPKKVTVVQLDETNKIDQKLTSLVGSEIKLMGVKPSEIITLKITF